MANKEEITLDFEFPFDIKKIWVTKKDNVILHCHDCLEINYVTSGKGLNIIENDIYELNANDIYLINNFQHHMAVSHEDLQMIIILFYPDFIWQNKDFDYNYLKSFFSKNHIIKDCTFNHLIFEILQEYNQKKLGYELVIKSKVMELLALCYRTIGENSNPINYLKMDDTLRHLLNIINNNIEKDLSLDFLSSECHMNKTYLSTYFKSNMGMNLKNYIKNLRINKAKALLKNSDKNITEICFQVGFNNVAHFSNIFKNHEGITPSEYRKSKFYDKISE